MTPNIKLKLKSREISFAYNVCFIWPNVVESARYEISNRLSKCEMQIGYACTRWLNSLSECSDLMQNLTDIVSFGLTNVTTCWAWCIPILTYYHWNAKLQELHSVLNLFHRRLRNMCNIFRKICTWCWCVWICILHPIHSSHPYGLFANIFQGV